MNDLISIVEDSPIIAAVKDDEGLEKAISSDCHVIFVLYGNICDIGEITRKIADKGKLPIVHIDLIVGMSNKDIVVDYIKNNTSAKGIISTKPMLVKRAVSLGLLGILRSFIIDSMAFNTLKKQTDQYKPDAIEIMPGIIPTIISELKSEYEIPIIAGGLIRTKKDIITVLDAGADAISTTDADLWNE